MVRGSFRHLVVVESGEMAGILSVRDIVRCWTQDGATSDMPESPPASGAQRSSGRRVETARATPSPPATGATAARARAGARSMSRRVWRTQRTRVTSTIG